MTQSGATTAERHRNRRVKSLDGTPETPPGPSRKWLGHAARVAGTLTLGAVVTHFVPLETVWRDLRQVPIPAILAMTAVFLMVHFLGALKWQVLVSCALDGWKIRQSIRCYFAGLFGNLMLPTIVGGDAVTIAVGIGQSPSKLPIVAATFVSRAVDFIALILIMTAGWVVLPSSGISYITRIQQFMPAILGIAGLGLVVVLAAGWSLRQSSRARRRLSRFASTVSALQVRSTSLVTALAMALSMQLALVGIAMWIGSLLRLDLDLGVWLFTWPLVKLATLLPATVLGLGARELAFAALLVPFSADPQRGVTIGLVFSCVVVIGNLLAGPISLFLGSDAQRAKPPNRGGGTGGL